MFRLLKQVRKAILEAGNLRKYVFYAMGEIALVVIGILIALQINNWNEQRKKIITVNEHLKSLVKSLEHDVRELTISMEFSESRCFFMQYLLDRADVPFDIHPPIPRPDTFIETHWMGPYPDTLNFEFIERNLYHLNNAFLDMVFNYSAINEINNLGIMSDLGDDSLRTLISEYYYFLNWRFGEQGVNRRYKIAEDLKNHFRNQYSISFLYPTDPEEIIKIIKADNKVIIMSKELAKVSYDHYWATQSLRESAHNLINVINKRVN